MKHPKILILISYPLQVCRFLRILDTMQSRLFFSFLILAILFAACQSSNQVRVGLDNPSNQTVSLQLGDSLFEVEAFACRYVQVPKGAYPFTVKVADRKLTGKTEITQDSGMFNLLGYEYVLWKEIWFNREKFGDMPPAEYLREDSIMLDGKPYYGQLKCLEKQPQFYPRQWDYDSRTSFPDELYLGSKDTLSKTKIFRKSDFIEEYSAMYELDPGMQRLLDSLVQAEKPHQ